MANYGLQEGDDYAVLVYRNGKDLLQLTGSVIGHNETAASLYTDGDEALLTGMEILWVAISACKWQDQRPRLKEMLEERIKELREESEAGESFPSPSDDLDDIPF
jgi:hypothetical protein